MLQHFILFMVGLIFGAIGIKAIVTRKITLYTSLWNSSPTDFPDNNRGAWARTELSGFIAVLIGIAYVLIGVAILVKGPEFYHWPILAG